MSGVDTADGRPVHRSSDVETDQPVWGSGSGLDPERYLWEQQPVIGPGGIPVKPVTTGEDPSVTLWRQALAPQPRYTTRGRHWWRETVHEAWSSAHHAWELMLEAAVAGGSRGGDEETEFREQHPEPRYKDFLTGMKRGDVSMYPDLGFGL